MSSSLRVCSALALVAVALGSGAALADPPKKAPEPQPDAELLEFLGTVDSTADANSQPDDGSWIEYLAQTDIDKAAQKAKPPGPTGAQTGASKVKSDGQ